MTIVPLTPALTFPGSPGWLWGECGSTSHPYSLCPCIISESPRHTSTPSPVAHRSCPRSSLSTPDPDQNPEEILDVNKYTKQHLQNAQRPIPSIDLGEEEEILDPKVWAPNEEDFIKPPPLEELVDPTKIKQTFIPARAN